MSLDDLEQKNMTEKNNLSPQKIDKVTDKENTLEKDILINSSSSKDKQKIQNIKLQNEIKNYSSISDGHKKKTIFDFDDRYKNHKINLVKSIEFNNKNSIIAKEINNYFSPKNKSKKLKFNQSSNSFLPKNSLKEFIRNKPYNCKLFYDNIKNKNSSTIKSYKNLDNSKKRVYKSMLDNKINLSRNDKENASTISIQSYNENKVKNYKTLNINKKIDVHKKILDEIGEKNIIENIENIQSNNQNYINTYKDYQKKLFNDCIMSLNFEYNDDCFNFRYSKNEKNKIKGIESYQDKYSNKQNYYNKNNLNNDNFKILNFNQENFFDSQKTNINNFTHKLPKNSRRKSLSVCKSDTSTSRILSENNNVNLHNLLFWKDNKSVRTSSAKRIPFIRLENNLKGIKGYEFNNEKINFNTFTQKENNLNNKKSIQFFYNIRKEHN